MKLLFCPDCGDVVKLIATFRSCRCGACRGRYETDARVSVEGERVEVIGIDNETLSVGVRSQTLRPERKFDLTAHLLPHVYENVVRRGRMRGATNG